MPPETSRATNGSTPPSLAIVALLAALSAESDHKACAQVSLVSDAPSRTSEHRGAIAPVRAIASWFSTQSCARDASAPAAVICISVETDPSMPTSGVIAPTSAIRILICWLPSDTLHTAIAASEATFAAAESFTFDVALVSTLTSMRTPPTSTTAS